MTNKTKYRDENKKEKYKGLNPKKSLLKSNLEKKEHFCHTQVIKKNWREKLRFVRSYMK